MRATPLADLGPPLAAERVPALPAATEPAVPTGSAGLTVDPIDAYLQGVAAAALPPLPMR